MKYFQRINSVARGFSQSPNEKCLSFIYIISSIIYIFIYLIIYYIVILLCLICPIRKSQEVKRTDYLYQTVET